ncbi:MAG: hypothetical protein WEE67_00915 [Chloroflexota bacterium]
MHSGRALPIAMAAALVAAALTIAPAGAAPPSYATTAGKVRLAGQTSLEPIDTNTEVRPGRDDVSDGTTSVHPGERAQTNRQPHGSGSSASPTASGPVTAGSQPQPAGASLLESWEGLNHFDQRFGSSDGNNAFSLEPPDQALCVGNGLIFESVNDVVAVYDTNGNLLSQPKSMNDFYNYPPAINRTTGEFGPFVFDPTCHFDPVVNRWFHVIINLESLTNGTLTGISDIDLAVSATGSPLGVWNIYHIPGQNDGTEGTPNHACGGGPCFPDYPHIGADAHGFFIAINEFDFFGPDYQGVNLYGLSKSQLAAGAAAVNMSLTFIDGFAEEAFTVWPAISPGTNQFETRNGGTEYFLSSTAAFNDVDGSSERIFAWALTNTRSLDTTPALQLKKVTVPVNRYVIPDNAAQRPGPTPLRECINDTKIVIQGLGRGCWRLFFAPQDQPAHNEIIPALDASPASAMQQVTFAGGRLYGALSTGVSGPDRAGIAWYAVAPSINRLGVLSATLAAQGLVAASGANNVIYPALGVRPDGKGVMAFTLVGPDHFPSAAYVTFSGNATGGIQIAAAGLGPDDGFTGYAAFVGDQSRPRWGDYGAAAFDGNTIWIASEYIAQTCTLAQWLNSNFRCGDTRTALANWSTRISQVRP